MVLTSYHKIIPTNFITSTKYYVPKADISSVADES
jgi:hypothetical protein